MSRNNNPIIHSLSSKERMALSSEKKSRALSVLSSFKYYILNKHAFNNIFQSTFHPAFETSYSDFILRPDYKQIISDSKEKADYAIKQEFLDNLFSIDLQASAIAFYIDGFRMEEQEYAEAATYSPELGVSFRYRLISEATIFTAEVGRSSKRLF